MRTSKVAVIDGDIILYKIGFEKKPQPEQVEGFSSSTVVLERTEEETIKSLDDFMFFIQNETACTHYVGFLSCPRVENFRNAIAITKPYKGNRENAEKPIHYRALRKHLEERYGFMSMPTYEADDLMASVGTQGLSVNGEEADVLICTIDKDLDQIVGKHWNCKTNESYVVSVEAAAKSLWLSVITGDSVDNIPGLPKVGKVGAHKILDNWSYSQYPAATLVAFIEKEGAREGIKKFAEMFQLVHLLRDLEVVVEPKVFRSATFTPSVEPSDDF